MRRFLVPLWLWVDAEAQALLAAIPGSVHLIK